MIEFIFYRALIQNKYLLQSVKTVEEKINGQNFANAGEVYGTYQTKFTKKISIFIGIINILFGICWTIPFALICEILLHIQLLYRICTGKSPKRLISNIFYYTSVLPGLSKRHNPRIFLFGEN